MIVKCDTDSSFDAQKLLFGITGSLMQFSLKIGQHNIYLWSPKVRDNVITIYSCIYIPHIFQDNSLLLLLQAKKAKQLMNINIEM